MEAARPVAGSSLGGFVIPQPDAVLGLGTALPSFVVEQAAAGAAVGGWFPAGHAARSLARRVFRLAGVAERRSVVDGFRPELPGPLLARPSPTTGERMALYARHAPPLAASAARRALDGST